MRKSHGEEIAICFMIGVFFAISLGVLYTNNIFVNKFIQSPLNSSSIYYGDFIHADLLESSGLVKKWLVSNQTSSDLLLHYSFDSIINGTVIDDSNNHYNGDVINSILTTGYYNNALYFNGINAYVYNNTFSNSITGITLSAYIKPVDLVDEERTIVGHYYSVAFEFNQQGSCLRMKIVINGTYYGTYLLIYAGLSTSEYKMVTFTYNGTVGCLYVNDLLIGSRNDIHGLIGYIDGCITIGEREGGDLCFYGSIDDVRIYNRGLTPLEVHQLYEGTYQTNYYEIWDGSTLKYQGLFNPDINDFALPLISITELQFIVVMIWLLIGIIFWSFKS